MAVGKLSSRTSVRDVVIGRVAVVRRRLAEVVGRAANADFRAGTSALGSGELEAELASVPPGDCGGIREPGVAEDG